MLTVCLAGTGGTLPLSDRWLTCCWIEDGGKAILIDCGEGTQIALKQAGCKLSHLEMLLLTHFHADHIAGLPGLLLTLGNYGKTTPLTICGPKGVQEVVQSLLIIAPVLPYPLVFQELSAENAGFSCWGDVQGSCIPLSHGVPCLGYRIDQHRKPIFNPQKAQALGIPPKLFGRLHSGQPVTLADGREITPDQVLDGARAPVSLCYCTDTLPIPEIARFAQGADLMIAEGMYGEDTVREKVQEKGHMLFSDAARLAGEAGAARLWLTHFSPALEHPEDFIDGIQEIFPDAVVGTDGMRIVLGQKTDTK